ncbi:MAG: serine/threonine protein kinase [Muribaculaceae bacterium]|nr:serine/threonine protein kinase [Muribaculaceae bacterium]
MAIIRLQGRQEKEAGIYYEVDSSSKTIGEGGMGRVYKGTCVNTRTGETRPVAIKFLYMDLPEQAIERARREASIRLRNDHLIEMLGFFETDEDRDGKIIKHYHVVSELLHGVSLADIIQGKCVDPNGVDVAYARQLMNDFQKDPDHFAKTVIKGVLKGLLALHDAGYIHRDIDPSNIFVTEDEKIKLIDFGICKQLKQLTTNDRQLTVAGSFMGKPEYASPELALGDLKHQNRTSDIYSMGVLLYQCLTGNVPFEGTRFDILDKQIKEKLPLQKIANKKLRNIIAKATDKRQELRYQTAAEMLVDLESLDVKRAASPAKKKAILMWSIAGAIAVIGAVVGFLFYRNHVEEQAIALKEKNYIDSLQNVVTVGVAKADSLTKIGLAHDEGYDAALVEAKEYFNEAADATQLIKDKGAVPAAKINATRREQCDNALKSAYSELTEKAALIAADPDPEVRAEADVFTKRASLIEKVLKK